MKKTYPAPAIFEPINHPPGAYSFNNLVINPQKSIEKSPLWLYIRERLIFFENTNSSQGEKDE